jgi:exodeoxyribonuclease-1
MTGYVFYAMETVAGDSGERIVKMRALHTDPVFTALESFEASCSPDISDYRSHYEMMRDVARQFRRWSPAIFLGFDCIPDRERILRTAFAQTLHDPFFFASGVNGRTDALRVVQASAVLAPGTIAMKRRSDRKLDSSLLGLRAANALPQELSDVQAAAEICRRIFQGAPDVVSLSARFSFSPAVPSFLDDEDVVIIGGFSSAGMALRTVTSLGIDPNRPSQSIVFDLEADPAQFLGLSDIDLAEHLKVHSTIRSLAHRSSPILLPADGELQSSTLPLPELQRRAEVVRSKELKSRLLALSPRNARIQAAGGDPVSVMSSIQPDDQQKLDRFHEAQREDRPALAATFSSEAIRGLARSLCT